jgi:hypothetical protein
MGQERRELTRVNARLPSRFSRCGFPDSRFAFLVCPSNLAELDPLCFLGGKSFNLVNSWFVWHIVGWPAEGAVGVENAGERRGYATRW